MPRERRQIKPAMIEHDVHCVECGYNLRGLPRREHCPECRTPIKRSLAGPLLRNVGTAWLQRVHRGLWLMHRVSIFAAIAIIGAPVINLYLGVFSNVSSAALTRNVLPLAMALWAALVCAGLWLATTPAPRADQRSGLQSTLERFALLSIPLVTIAWVLLALSVGGAITGLLGNPLGQLGIGAPSQSVSRGCLIALAVITWLQSMLLARWLNRIDARVDHQVRTEPTLFDRINWMLTNSKGNPPGASAEFWRGGAKLAPVVLAALMIFSGIGTKAFPWWCIALTAFLPLMILLTMRRTVRDVGVERTLGEERRARDAAQARS